MAPFQYTPLQSGRQIRVLELAPGQRQGTLKVKLIHAEIDEDQVYSALSYVWGTSIDRTQIECDGAEADVTQNLAEALRHLQQESEPRYLWVDALCINQQDMEEKSHQVALMKDIYAYANDVIVWLGPDEAGDAPELFEEIDEVLELLEDTIDSNPEDLKEIVSARLNDICSPVLDNLSLLFWEEYFTRTWVIQEVGLTNRPLAHWGHSVINFNKIGLIAMACLKYVPRTLSSFGYLERFERAANLYQTYLPQLGSQRLYDIIHRARLNQVTDSRDKVYAFISHPSAVQDASDLPYTGKEIQHNRDMTDEEVRSRALSMILAPNTLNMDFASLDYVEDHSLRPPFPGGVIANRLLKSPRAALKLPRYSPGSSFIVPDYNLSVVDVYLDFALQMIQRTSSLEILSFVQHNAPLPPIGPSFPSWVPRWDAPTDISLLGTRNSPHFASANRLPILIPSLDQTFLTVRGLIFDTIATRTISLTREDFNNPSKTSPLWSMSKTCQVSTHPVPDYPRFHVPGVLLTQDPDRIKAFQRTWIAGRTAGTADAPSDGFNPDLDFAAYQLDFFKRTVKEKNPPPLEMILKIISLEEEARGGNGERYAEVAGDACHGRSFFITKGGFFGIGPGILEEGDLIVVLLGADVPFVVRKKEKCSGGGAGWRFALIGECYVHGLMTGDAIRAWGGPDGDLTDITLC